MAKYGKKAQEEVEKTMHEHKHEGKFKDKKQAVAVGLNKARKKGGKVPDNKQANGRYITGRRTAALAAAFQLRSAFRQRQDLACLWSATALQW